MVIIAEIIIVYIMYSHKYQSFHGRSNRLVLSQRVKQVCMCFLSMQVDNQTFVFFINLNSFTDTEIADPHFDYGLANGNCLEARCICDTLADPGFFQIFTHGYVKLVFFQKISSNSNFGS